jgi:hypothetical protein
MPDKMNNPDDPEQIGRSVNDEAAGGSSTDADDADEFEDGDDEEDDAEDVE